MKFTIASICFLLLAGCSAMNNSRSNRVIDPRDGRSYGVVTIGNQQWLSENAKFADIESWCYNDDPRNCERNGRLYPWKSALQACPAGWGLPTDQDWMDLEVALGMDPAQARADKMRGTNQGAQLREGGTAGFDAPISGYRRPDGSYARNGERAAFWASTESNAEDSWHRDIRSDVDTIYRSPVTKTYALTVRCIRSGSK